MMQIQNRETDSWYKNYFNLPNQQFFYLKKSDFTSKHMWV